MLRLQMILKHFGMGYKYWFDPFNIIDGAVVISTAVEYSLADFGEGGSASALRILRFGRIARTFKVGALDVRGSFYFLSPRFLATMMISAVPSKWKKISVP